MVAGAERSPSLTAAETVPLDWTGLHVGGLPQRTSESCGHCAGRQMAGLAHALAQPSPTNVSCTGSPSSSATPDGADPVASAYPMARASQTGGGPGSTAQQVLVGTQVAVSA